MELDFHPPSWGRLGGNPFYVGPLGSRREKGKSFESSSKPSRYYLVNISLRSILRQRSHRSSKVNFSNEGEIFWNLSSNFGTMIDWRKPKKRMDGSQSYLKFILRGFWHIVNLCPVAGGGERNASHFHPFFNSSKMKAYIANKLCIFFPWWILHILTREIFSSSDRSDVNYVRVTSCPADFSQK